LTNKHRLILPAFLTISTVTIVVALGARWLFDIQYDVLRFKLEIWETWISMFLPLAAILIWLRPKIHRLTFSSNLWNARVIFYSVAWVAISLPLMLAQQYLTSETGKLEKINSTDEIGPNANVRYIKLDNFRIAREMVSKYITTRSAGRKGNRKIQIDVYVVVPLVNDVTPRSLSDLNNWYGLKFTKALSADLSDASYHRLVSEFIGQCEANAMRYPYHDVNYFTNIPESYELDNYRQAIRTKTNLPTSDTHVLTPNFQPFAKRSGGSALWSIVSFVTLHLLFLALLHWPDGLSNNSQPKPRAQVRTR
jgi:rhomboid protease GluP